MKANTEKTNGKYVVPMSLKFLTMCMALLWFLDTTRVYAQTKNQLLTTAAWDAYNTNNYVLAISKATECIDEFSDDAVRQQGEVESSGKKPPLVIKPKTAVEKEEVIERGPLNDVATCWWIRGESNWALSGAGKRETPDISALQKARDAYKEALKFSHGRCWDTNGFFWSPPDKARGKLARTESLLSTSRENK
jgi:hypothetical protein